MVTEQEEGFKRKGLWIAARSRLICHPWWRMLLATQPNMEVSEAIQCPYCGQRCELVLDTSIPTQRFTTDCEVCCRPFEVSAECEPGEILSLEVQAG